MQGIDHIGIAVKSLEEGLAFYRDRLGMRLDAVEDVPSEGVRVAILWSGNTRIELLEPSSPQSPIAAFIEKRGPGIHHLAFSAPGIAEELTHLTSAGVQVIPPAPRQGAHHCQVAFLHPKQSQGVLIELVQRPQGG